VVCFALSGILWLSGATESAASYFSGSFLILVNVTVLAVAWSFITQKKFIALSVSIIVFKYAILGVIIYRLLKFPWLNPVWMSIGLGSLLITTILFGLLQSLNNQKEK
jgi:ascorbate-specific PTS system EIIC-type component UlaA